MMTTKANLIIKAKSKRAWKAGSGNALVSATEKILLYSFHRLMYIQPTNNTLIKHTLRFLTMVKFGTSDAELYDSTR